MRSREPKAAGESSKMKNENRASGLAARRSLMTLTRQLCVETVGAKSLTKWVYETGLEAACIDNSLAGF